MRVYLRVSKSPVVSRDGYPEMSIYRICIEYATPLPKFASYLRGAGARAPWRRLSVVVFPCVGVRGYPVCTRCVPRPSVATSVVAKIYKTRFFLSLRLVYVCFITSPLCALSRARPRGRAAWWPEERLVPLALLDPCFGANDKIGSNVVCCMC